MTSATPSTAARGRFTGTRAEYGSVSARLLAALVERPYTVMTTAEITEAAGFDRDHFPAVRCLSTYGKRTTGAWASVHRVKRGHYVYRPETSTQGLSEAWFRIEQTTNPDGALVTVLRAPDGSLWEAVMTKAADAQQSPSQADQPGEDLFDEDYIEAALAAVTAVVL